VTPAASSGFEAGGALIYEGGLAKTENTMDATRLEDQLTAIRARDDKLEERLAELDSKLSVWLALVQAGHAALLELARKVVPSAVPRESRAPLVQPVDPGPARPPPAPSADDAFLQTLDRETARAITVKRRLCHGSRSLQQLLEEYRAAQAQEQTGPSRQPTTRWGWWRRKND
jgi:hypothetical protein